MTNVTIKIIFFLFVLSDGFTIQTCLGSDSTRNNRWLRHRTYVGIAKNNYFVSKAPTIFGDVKIETENVSPSYNLGYEAFARITKNLHIGLGTAYTTGKTRLTFSDFVSPNTLSSLISMPLNHSYISIPLTVYWKFPVSSLSSVYLSVGVESFKTLALKQKEGELVSIYKNDGTVDHNYQFISQIRTESFSLLRTVTTGVRFEFNERSKNRLSMGVNYYLMQNYFPMAIQADMFVGNKNFEKTNYLYFKGLALSLGYLW